MLATIQKQFFPNTEVVLVNLASGEEAKMNDLQDQLDRFDKFLAGIGRK